MKKKVSVSLVLMLCFVMIASLAGCGSKKGKIQKKSNDDILKVVDAEWYGIDAYQIDSSANFQGLVGEAPFKWDPDNDTIVDGVCTNWTVSEDGKTVTFDVPEGMFYSTGEQVEPEDVVASIQHGLDVSPYKDAYTNIESMSVDGRQVTLNLSGYRSDMLYSFCTDFMCIIDKAELDSMSNDELMWGCHPYGMFSVKEYVSGSEVKLIRNDKYVTHYPLAENKGPSHIKEISDTFNVKDYTALESLKSGETDMLCSISNDNKNALKDVADITIEDVSYPEIDYMELNTDKGIMQDKDLRRAFLLLINREALCELTNGGAAPAYSMIYDTMQNFSPEAKEYFTSKYANNPDEAIKIIEGKGFSKNADGYYEKDGQVFEVDYYGSSSEISSVMGEGLQGQMADYGIKVNLNSIDWNYVHEQAKQDDYHVAVQALAWAEPILIFNACYHDPTAPTNTEEYTKAVEDIATTVDTTERTKKVGELQKVMFDNLDNIPFFTTKGYMAHNKYLTGFNIKKDGTYNFNDVKWAD